MAPKVTIPIPPVVHIPGIPDPLPQVKVPIPGTGSGILPSVSIPGVHSIISSTEAAGRIATDLTQGAFWVRIGEFAIGAILITVGVAAMTKTPQHVRKATRATERGARVVASVTPQGRAVNKIAKRTATVARRARS